MNGARGFDSMFGVGCSMFDVVAATQGAIGSFAFVRGYNLYCTGGWHETGQTKLRVNDARSPFSILSIDNNCDLDLGRRDELNINTRFAETLENACAEFEMRAHSDPD